MWYLFGMWYVLILPSMSPIWLYPLSWGDVFYPSLEVQHTLKTTVFLLTYPIGKSYCPIHLARSCPVHPLWRSISWCVVLSSCTADQLLNLDESRCSSPVKKVSLESVLLLDSFLWRACGRCICLLERFCIKILRSLFYLVRATIIGPFTFLLYIRGGYKIYLM